MPIDIPTAARAFIPAGSEGLALVLRASRAHLFGVPDSGLARLAASLTASGSWTETLAAAAANRLTSFVAAGLGEAGVELPEEAGRHIARYRTETFHLNTRNLMTLRKVVPLIEAEGIAVAAIKGPVQQQLVYGDFFAKPAGDVDLLVSAADFLRARGVIEQAGFSLPQECASPWWRIFLGEQHLLSGEASFCTVDLHHRLQQPGAPQPAAIGRFLEQRRRVEVGSASLPALSPRDALLLSCMSLVKALVHREPAGGYAADIAAGLSRATPEVLAGIAAEAEDQGLRNTLRLALRAVEAVFGVTFDIARPGEPRPLDHTTTDDLVGMVVTPLDPGVEWAKRRAILWALVDSGPIAFVREATWAVGGEAARRIFQVQTARPSAATA